MRKLFSYLFCTTVFFVSLTLIAKADISKEQYQVEAYTWCNGPLGEPGYEQDHPADCSDPLWNEVDLDQISSLIIESNEQNDSITIVDLNGNKWTISSDFCANNSDKCDFEYQLDSETGEFEINFSKLYQGIFVASQHLSIYYKPERKQLTIFLGDGDTHVSFRVRKI